MTKYYVCIEIVNTKTKMNSLSLGKTSKISEYINSVAEITQQFVVEVDLKTRCLG